MPRQRTRKNRREQADLPPCEAIGLQPDYEPVHPWFPIPREVVKRWQESGRRYERTQAEIDLFYLASHRRREVVAAGFTIELEPGELAMSFRRFAHRWRWGIASVVRFMAHLEAERVIEKGEIRVMKAEHPSGTPPTVWRIGFYSGFFGNESQAAKAERNAQAEQVQTIREQTGTKNGRNSRGELPPSSCEWAEAEAFAQEAKIPQPVARTWWERSQERGWTAADGQPLRNWKLALQGYARKIAITPKVHTHTRQDFLRQVEREHGPDFIDSAGTWWAEQEDRGWTRTNRLTGAAEPTTDPLSSFTRFVEHLEGTPGALEAFGDQNDHID